jgi:hypothetical protein
MRTEIKPITTRSSPRRLIEESIRQLERNSSIASQETYQRLLQASELRRRCERILLINPATEWSNRPPVHAPLKRVWGKGDAA